MTPTLVRGNRSDLVPLGDVPPTSVSVVIPHYREQECLDRVLEALSLQSFPATDLEVVVADDGTPGGVECPQRLRSGAPVTVVRQDDLGFRAAAARNLGASSSTGELLAFVDADTVPEPSFVEALVALPRRNPDVMAVGRRRHTDLGGWSPARVRRWLGGEGPAPAVLAEPAWLLDAYAANRGLLDSDDRSFRYVLSSVLACSRELFDDLGGFDERYGEYGGEDWDLGYRAYNNGAVLTYAPDAVAWHDGPSWEGRAHAPDAKTYETLRLAALIPEPATRGAARPGELPDVLVDLVDGDWPATAVAATAQCVLDQTHADLALRLPSSCDRRLVESLLGTGRVRVGSWSTDQARRARARVTLHAPVVLRRDAVARLVREVAAPEGGRARAAVGGEPLVTIESTRLVGRARRWSRRGMTESEVARLAFGDTEIDGTYVLGEALPRDGLQLAGLFQRRSTAEVPA